MRRVTIANTLGALAFAALCTLGTAPSMAAQGISPGAGKTYKTSSTVAPKTTGPVGNPNRFRHR